MSKENAYLQAIRLISSNSALADFEGVTSENIIKEAESALGFSFPLLFRKFISQFGAGSFGSFDIFGIIGQNIHAVGLPNGVWLTLDERLTGNLPRNFFLFSAVGNGEYFALNTSASENGHVYAIRTSRDVAYVSIEKISEDFGSFLLEQIQDRLV
jgi:antitoxin YobK